MSDQMWRFVSDRFKSTSNRVTEDEISGESTPESREATPKVMTEGGEFILQAGSFKQYQEADRLKASLALLGVQAHIQKVEVNNDTWHRVRIGPFSDTRRLHETLNTLKQNNIHAMTMELKN